MPSPKKSHCELIIPKPVRKNPIVNLFGEISHFLSSSYDFFANHRYNHYDPQQLQNTINARDELSFTSGWLSRNCTFNNQYPKDYTSEMNALTSSSCECRSDLHGSSE